MSSATAQLSALATDLDELSRRIDVLAHELDRDPTDRAAANLFETERALRGAIRRLTTARRELDRIGG